MPEQLCLWQVVMGLQKEAGFLPELFRRLEKGPEDPAWGDLLGFLQEMCGLAKHLQPSSCSSLLGRLHQLGLFHVRCPPRFPPPWVCRSTLVHASCPPAAAFTKGCRRQTAAQQQCMWSAERTAAAERGLRGRTSTDLHLQHRACVCRC